jgi:hypothetical protein
MNGHQDRESTEPERTVEPQGEVRTSGMPTYPGARDPVASGAVPRGGAEIPVPADVDRGVLTPDEAGTIAHVHDHAPPLQDSERMPLEHPVPHAAKLGAEDVPPQAPADPASPGAGPLPVQVAFGLAIVAVVVVVLLIVLLV